MATSKPDILIILLQKLMEEGNVLYKKGKMKEAAQRYQHALRRFPREGLEEEIHAFNELRVSLYLNLSRCRRKMNDFGMAEEFASKALELKSNSHEAYYARARAKRNSRQFSAALADLREALKLSPSNQEVKKLLGRVEDECKQLQKTQQKLPQHQLAVQNTDDTGESIGQGLSSPLSLEEIEEEEHAPYDETFRQAVQPTQCFPTQTIAQDLPQQKTRPVSPQDGLVNNKYIGEAVAHHGLIMPPTKQAQIVKTNKHLSSPQSATRTGSSTCNAKTQTSSKQPPLSLLLVTPSANVACSKTQPLDPIHTFSSGGTSTGVHSALPYERFSFTPSAHLNAGERTLLYTPSSFPSTAATETLATHFASTVDGAATSHVIQINCSEIKPYASLVKSFSSSSSASSINNSSSPLNVAGSSSLHDCSKGPDVGSKDYKTGQTLSGTGEHRPRPTPFMGITDKAARSVQSIQQNRSWHNLPAEGLIANSALVGNLPSATAAYSNQMIKALPSSQTTNTHFGMLSTEADETMLPSQIHDSRGNKAASHSYHDGISTLSVNVEKESQMPNVLSAKPKRSFVESNV